MKKKIYHILAGILFLLLMSPGNAQAQGLTFSISLNKTVYAVGEPIVCTMTLKNTGATALVVNHRFLVNNPIGPHEVSFQAIDPALKTIALAVRIRAGAQSLKYILLQPGSTTAKTFVFSHYFPSSAKGQYSVTGFYENKLNAPASLALPASWKGRLRSNKAIFTLN